MSGVIKSEQHFILARKVFLKQSLRLIHLNTYNSERIMNKAYKNHNMVKDYDPTMRRAVVFCSLLSDDI